MKFTELDLPAYIIEGLANQGIKTATEIQALTMPIIKNGSDVIGLSQTGSGKTYAYGIPALECVDTELAAVQFLIVCPTRELTSQITEDFRKLTGLTSKISIAPIFGGSNIDRQFQALRKGAKIVVGTPGRLMDHLRRKTLKLNNLKMIIIDEADEMLNMGFKEDIETILKSTPENRQTVMFSATMPPEIIRLTKQYMKEAVLIKTENQGSPHALIKQYFVNCERFQKTEVLCRIYEEFKPWISIVFCNTKKMTDELADVLVKKGLPAVSLNGDMRQNERKRVMDSFKKNAVGGILVATDVAARGIDIKNVDIVINYDFPNNEDYYVHRIGRTGRAGKEGVAFTILNSKQQAMNFHDLANKSGGTAEEYIKLSSIQWALKGFDKSESKRKSLQGSRSKPGEKKEFNKGESQGKPTSSSKSRWGEKKEFSRGRSGFKNSAGQHGTASYKDSNVTKDSYKKNDNSSKVHTDVLSGDENRLGRSGKKAVVSGKFAKTDFRKTQHSNTNFKEKQEEKVDFRKKQDGSTDLKNKKEGKVDFKKKAEYSTGFKKKKDRKTNPDKKNKDTGWHASSFANGKHKTRRPGKRGT